MPTLCSPWVSAESMTLCEPCLPEGSSGPGDTSLMERGALVASWLLFRATRFQYPGLCTDVVRPCTAGGGWQHLANPTGAGSRPIGDGYDWWAGGPCGCSGEPLSCGCHIHPNVVLPGVPLVDVPELLIDGQEFTAFKINRDRQLIRTDGNYWPCCQNLGLDATEPGTWQITYRYGAMPPPDGVAAAEALACELAQAWEASLNGTDCDGCRLPRRLTSITREGMTAAAIDPFEFLDEGRFGIAEVDYFVRMANGGADPATPPARVLLAADMFGGHARIR